MKRQKIVTHTKSYLLRSSSSLGCRSTTAVVLILFLTLFNSPPMSNSVCPFKYDVLARRLSTVDLSSFLGKLLVAARDTRRAVAALVRPSFGLNSRSDVRLQPGLLFGLFRSSEASESLAKAFITDELSQFSGDDESPEDGGFLLLLLHVTYTEVLGWAGAEGRGAGSSSL